VNALYCVCCFLLARLSLRYMEAANGWVRLEWFLWTLLWGAGALYRLRIYLQTKPDKGD